MITTNPKQNAVRYATSMMLSIEDDEQTGSVRHTDSTFETCQRCGGSGCKTHEVAPWVRPVAKLDGGYVEAEVTVTCDACGGSGLVRS